MRAIFATFLLLLGAPVMAQAFPAKPVHIIVPFPPAGGADSLARIMAPYLQKLWGQPVIVENKPGAAGRARRSVTLPDLPTAAESGLPGYEAIG